METTRRPLTEQETRDLRRLTSSKDELSNDVVSTLFVFMVVFAAGTGLVRWIAGPPRGATLAVVSALAAAVALWALVTVRRGLGRALAQSRSQFARDLAAGEAECSTYEAVDALRVEEAEDEGSSYYLKLADGRVLFLSGQYLYDYEAGTDEDGADEDGQPTPARFPCRRFTLSRAPESRLFLDLELLGAPFPPSGTLPPFTTDEHRAGSVPEDGDLLTLDFERLRTKRAG